MSRSYLERVLAHKPSPDFNQLLKVLARQKPDRPTLFEFFLNGPLYEVLNGGVKDPGWGQNEKRFPVLATAFRQAGYDYVTSMAAGFGFPTGDRNHAATISLNEGILLSDRASFERYPWPDPEITADFYPKIAPLLPDGMKVCLFGPGGVLENAIRLIGYDALCFLLLDDPGLARDIFDAIGSRLLRYYEIAAAQDIPVGTVKSRLHGAMKHLRRTLNESGFERDG